MSRATALTLCAFPLLACNAELDLRNCEPTDMTRERIVGIVGSEEASGYIKATERIWLCTDGRRLWIRDQPLTPNTHRGR